MVTAKYAVTKNRVKVCMSKLSGYSDDCRFYCLELWFQAIETLVSSNRNFSFK